MDTYHLFLFKVDPGVVFCSSLPSLSDGAGPRIVYHIENAAVAAKRVIIADPVINPSIDKSIIK